MTLEEFGVDAADAAESSECGSEITTADDADGVGESWGLEKLFGAGDSAKPERLCEQRSAYSDGNESSSGGQKCIRLTAIA